ncbi:MAG: ribosome biogenesis GTPase Der [Deltaproteobacteria bacterium]|nr:ribosome biogenesis GTPase Der [Deltaproteobacteria bacterium]MBW2018514.1 ribosome biogenesis GTPase Der [Deltaproteobacteria bacterium]MBW2073249.1 ribosome biogenesis GTPase Der [Deltaproteobacteria bacterium]RLB83303.1 MAG: ribosome biogenesis GTPase Der [Deltaproteobacteria bacterium]
MKPIVAIVGRPNVGKSTFFNRITKSRKALVDNFPGVTRDRIYEDAQWDEVPFTLVDTGGFSDFESEGFGSLVRYQVMQAIEEADAILMLLDGREGPTPIDTDLVHMLRRSSKPVFYGVNKIDGPRHEWVLADFSVLGVDPLYSISAEQGYGVGDLMDALTAVLPQSTHEPISDRIRLAVIGRPNVGKSSLINRILGDDRLVVSDIPGTTRDAVDTICKVNKKEYVLIDTAGIRKRGRVKRKVEKFSIIKALKSLNRCDIALVMMDAFEGVTAQDVKIASYALERGRACIILLNKWDLVEKNDKMARQYVDAVKDRLKFLSFAPILTISALTGQRTFKIFDWVETVYEQYTTRISTGQLNRIFQTVVEQHQPPSYRERRIKFYYATQVFSAPPTFVCFVNYPEGIPLSYERYMINQLREALGLDKTPLRLIFRKREKR